jgi:hypothetical protein
MKKNIRTYTIRDREAGNVIESGLTHKQALSMLKRFEKTDKEDGVFVSNFYEIV